MSETIEVELIGLPLQSKVSLTSLSQQLKTPVKSLDL